MHWPRTEENYAGPMTKILHRLFFILTFSFPVFSPCFFWPWPLQPHVKTDEKKQKKKEMTGHEDANRARETWGQVGLTFLSSERLGAGWGALDKGSSRCARQVGFSSTSLLASATRVSHGMQWHQIFTEHAAKNEEWCSPGQWVCTLNWSSAAHKCRKKQNNTTKY